MVVHAVGASACSGARERGTGRVQQAQRRSRQLPTAGSPRALREGRQLGCQLRTPGTRKKRGNALLHAWRRQIHRYKHTHTHAQGRLPIAPAAHLGGRRGAGELRKGHDDCTRRAKIDVVTKSNVPSPPYVSPIFFIGFIFFFLFLFLNIQRTCHKGQWVAKKDADVDADGAPSACWGIPGLGTCAARASSDAPGNIPPRASCCGGSWPRLSARAAHGRGQPADRR